MLLEYAHANTSGSYAHANTSGNESIACALGVESKAKAENGWIVIVNWVYKTKWQVQKIHSAKVGSKILGVKIKPNVWYWFEDGVLKYEQ